MKKSLLTIGVGLLIVGNSAFGSVTNDENEIKINTDVEIFVPDSDEQPKSN